MKEGDWYYSPQHKQLCRVIDTHALWGETIYRSGCRADSGLNDA